MGLGSFNVEYHYKERWVERGDFFNEPEISDLLKQRDSCNDERLKDFINRHLVKLLVVLPVRYVCTNDEAKEFSGN